MVDVGHQAITIAHHMDFVLQWAKKKWKALACLIETSDDGPGQSPEQDCSLRAG